MEKPAEEAGAMMMNNPGKTEIVNNGPLLAADRWKSG
jgi:hypothetical protein